MTREVGDRVWVELDNGQSYFARVIEITDDGFTAVLTDRNGRTFWGDWDVRLWPGNGSATSVTPSYSDTKDQP